MPKPYLRKLLKVGGGIYCPVPYEIREALLLQPGDNLAIWIHGREVRFTRVELNAPAPDARKHQAGEVSKKPWLR